MPQSGFVQVQIQSILDSALDLGTPQSVVNYLKTLAFTSGTGANQADQIWHDQRTLGASASETLDLAGVLTNAFGATVTFARIRALLCFAAAANSNTVILGNAAANGFISWVGGATHTVTVRPGGLLLLVAPDATAYAVTAGTADQLKILNGGAGTSVTYDLILLGASS